jgi:hypothetical protein
MIQLAGVATMVAGLALSASTFGLAMKAARGEGSRKLAPLSASYWTGLVLIIAGVWLQADRHTLPALIRYAVGS